jgi:hypothetical protein
VVAVRLVKGALGGWRNQALLRGLARVFTMSMSMSMSPSIPTLVVHFLSQTRDP